MSNQLSAFRLCHTKINPNKVPWAYVACCATGNVWNGVFIVLIVLQRLLNPMAVHVSSQVHVYLPIKMAYRQCQTQTVRQYKYALDRRA